MLNIIRKSLTRRLLILLLIIGIIAGFAAYYYWGIDKMFPLYYSLAGLSVIFLIFIIIIYKSISRPLKVLTKQMKYLISGKSYKKIYTNRIDEIGVIAQFFNEVTENLESISHKLKDAQRMASELQVASNIQMMVLPSQTPKIPGLELCAKTRPAVEIGGDNFDFINKGDSSYFYIGDVTGHGVPSALVMMMANTLLHTYTEIYDNLYDIVVNTNRQLKPRIKSAMFMTMVMLKWDQKNEKMSYLGAGHEHILVYKPSTGKIEAKVTGGIALGMVPDNSKIVKELPIDLEKGDIVVLYTDGITEAKNDAGEMFGLERLMNTITKHATTYGPEGISHHTATDFSEYVGNAEQLDDITLIVIKYTGKEETTVPAVTAQTGTVTDNMKF